MGQMDPGKLGKSGPKVIPDDLEAEAAVLKIASVEESEVDDDESATGKRVSWIVKFEELGEKALWLNKTQAEYLVERLGSDTEAMIGQWCCVEKHQSKYGKKTYDKVWISPPESWDDLLTEAGVPSRKRTVPKMAAPKAKAKGRR